MLFGLILFGVWFSLSVCLFVCLFVCPICSFVCLFFCSFACSLVCLFVCKFVYLFVRSFIRVFVRSFVKSHYWDRGRPEFTPTSSLRGLNCEILFLNFSHFLTKLFLVYDPISVQCAKRNILRGQTPKSKRK